MNDPISEFHRKLKYLCVCACTDQRCYVVSIIPGATTKILHLHF